MPFTREEFLGVFAAYNEACWPVAVGLWLLTFVAGARWVLGARRGESFLRFVLGVNWLWAGAAYHAAFFTRINPAAWLFSAMFLVQSVVFFVPGRFLSWNVARPLTVKRQSLGFALLAYGLAYPAIVHAEGLPYPFAPTFGVPCPTTILTVGFLAASSTRSAVESIIPILWSLVGGSASWLLGVRADFVLLAAGLALGLDILRWPLTHKGAML